MEPANIGHRHGQFLQNMGWQIICASFCGTAFMGNDPALALLNVPTIACLGAALWSFARLRDSRPALRVDETGITDNTSYFPGGLVRWEEIASIEESTYLRHPVLLVRLHDVNSYLARVPTWERGILRSNQFPFGTPLVIAQGNLDTRFSEVKAKIEEHRLAWEARQAAPTNAATNQHGPSRMRHWWTSVPPEERATVHLERKG